MSANRGRNGRFPDRPLADPGVRFSRTGLLGFARFVPRLCYSQYPVMRGAGTPKCFHMAFSPSQLQLLR